MPSTRKCSQKSQKLISSPYFSPKRRAANRSRPCNVPESPTKRTSTSPYFSPACRVIGRHYDTLESPSKGSTKKQDFMTFDIHLPLGPDIDDVGDGTETTITIDDDDVAWYKAQFKMLDDPLYAFNLRKSTYLNFKLYHAKPVLIQEKVADDPWKLLVAVMLLNKTAGKNSIPIFWEIVERWPTPENLSQADVDELRVMIQPLGLQSLRAKRLISLSSAYLADPPRPDRLHTSRAKIEFVQLDLQTQRPKFVHTLEYPRTPVSHLPGCGPYALDSYRIFCMPDEEWKKVMPTDKELIRYIKWKWAFEGCRWEPVNGLVAPLDSDYLEALPSILSC